MKQQKTLLALSMLVSAAITPAAEASLYDFSYTFGGNTLAGIMDGTLQGDNNTVAVNSILDSTLNGSAVPSLSFVFNADKFYSVKYPSYYPIQPGFSNETMPWVSLDGSYMNLVAFTTSDGGNGIDFSADSSLAQILGGPTFFSGASYGAAHTPFVQSNWQISAVPLPATLPMFAAGVATMAWLRRKVA
jgi:hypothetical protein